MHFERGDVVSAAVLTDLAAAAQAARLACAPDGVVGDGRVSPVQEVSTDTRAGGPIIVILGECRRALVTNPVAGDPQFVAAYNWTEQFMDDDGTQTDTELDGDPDHFPAYEINGNGNLANGTRALIFRGPGDYFLFTACGA